MSRIIAAIKLKVQCADGCTHEGVTLAVQDGRQIYLTEEDAELHGVIRIDECVAVLPPMALAAVLSNSREVS